VSVYFVTCREAGAVKIGSSVEPHARLSEIQWGCPLELKLEAILPGGTEEEFRYHAWFADDRIRGEWFTLTPMIETLIEQNPASDLPPDHDRTAQAQAKKLGLRPNQRGYVAALAEARVEATATKKAAVSFPSKHLTKSQKARVAVGDIHFPFRGKIYG
jgi:acetyl esterase/lipase